MKRQARTISPGVFDSFSGPAAQLPPAQRTPANVLAVLRRNPRVSTWDMSETPWLRGCIDALKNNGQITEDKDEPYPWHLYYIVKNSSGAAPADIGGAQS